MMGSHGFDYSSVLVLFMVFNRCSVLFSKTEITKTLTKVQTDLGDAKEESEKLGIEDKVKNKKYFEKDH